MTLHWHILLVIKPHHDVPHLVINSVLAKFARRSLKIGGSGNTVLNNLFGFNQYMMFDSANNDLDYSKIPSTDFKNKPDGWKTTSKSPDGNFCGRCHREKKTSCFKNLSVVLHSTSSSFVYDWIVIINVCNATSSTFSTMMQWSIQLKNAMSYFTIWLICKMIVQILFSLLICVLDFLYLVILGKAYVRKKWKERSKFLCFRPLIICYP